MVGFRPGSLPREMEGGYPGSNDLFGNECQKDGQAVTEQGAEDRTFSNGMIKSRKEQRDKGRERETRLSGYLIHPAF